jgi:aminoglycoside phosphotransferase (APT) family kinase protein
MTFASGASGAPDWLTRLWPGELVTASRLPWGFTNDSWAVTLADGRRLAVTKEADPGAARAADAWLPGVRDRLLAAGLPIAEPVAAPGSASTSAGIRVSVLLDGDPGASLLGDADGARAVGRICGAVSRRVANVPVDGLAVPRDWADPDELGRRAEAWASAIAADLDEAGRADLASRIDSLPGVLAERGPVLVHGDLVPVNVLVRDGELAGVLDLETVRLADRLFDAAWFGWIVTDHHPDVAPAARAGFAEGAAVDLGGPAARAVLELLPILRILEILAGLAPRSGARAGWTRHLQAAIGTSSSRR